MSRVDANNMSHAHSSVSVYDNGEGGVQLWCIILNRVATLTFGYLVSIADSCVCRNAIMTISMRSNVRQKKKDLWGRGGICEDN